MPANTRGKKPKPNGPEEVLLHLLDHPLRKRLLRICVEAEEMRSPKELKALAAPEHQSVSNVSYHVRVLVEHGAVELVAEQPHRGSVEHFYETTSLVDEVPWGRAALGVGSSAV